MRKKKAFRPIPGEALEDRAVPATGITGLPAVDAQRVAAAFFSFEKTYYQDVQSILMPTGTTNPSANRSAFDTAIASAANDLNAAIDKVIANLPTASALQTTVQNELLGGAQGMVGQLQALPTPTEAAPGAMKAFTRIGVATIDKVGHHVTAEVAAAPAPVGTIDDKTMAQVVGKVHDAFKAFGSAYINDLKTILLPSGTTDPTSHRAAFDAAVAKDLATLNASITSAVTVLPKSLADSLTLIAGNNLLTTTPPSGKSLQEVLVAIKTPKGTEGTPVYGFATASMLAIGGAEAQLAKDGGAAVAAYNASLVIAPPGSTGGPVA